ncbi:MAG: ABC transporter permease [Ruminococcus sp.]|nr:ABC transporter permease [Ruminococcus sp.]
MKRQTMFLKMITASLLRRRSRMLVALLAIAVGATILSGLVTIYYDVPRQMGEQFRNYGANMIFTPSGSDKLSTDAINKAKGLIDSKELVGTAPYRYENITVYERPLVAAATDFEGAEKTCPYWRIDGEWPSKNGEALVGKETAETLDLRAGDTVTLVYDLEGQTASTKPSEKAERNQNSLEFKVTGILDTGGNEEKYIFVSIADMESLTSKSDIFDMTELSVSASQEQLSDYAEKISSEVDGLSARLVKRVTQSENTVLSKLQALVLLVTIIVLLLTMICVATTMMAVVTERRKEVGLRKALGASNRSIIFEFMGEGLLLGAIGGLLGSIFGFIFAQAVSVNVFNSSIQFHWILIPITILVSVLVTGISCVLPVRSATDVDPALVLKGE